MSVISYICLSANTLSAGLIASEKPGTWLVLGVCTLTMIGCVLAARGRISCGPGGIYARNSVFEYDFPWNTILEAVPGDRVVIAARDGRRYRLWAVQKSNLAILLDRRSVVEEAVEKIEAYIRVSAENVAGDARVMRRIAWPGPAEISLIMALGPGAYVLGLLV
jgi:hypothetical protein